MSKIGDFLNPLPEVGGSLAKGATVEAIKQVRDFLDDYPPAEALAKGRKVKLVIEIQAIVED